MPLSKTVGRLSVHLNGHPNKSLFKDLKAYRIGKFLSIQGNVLRVSPITPLITQAAFSCTKCLQTMVLVFMDGVLRMPSKCGTNRCTGKNLVLDRQSPLTQYINMQRVRLQEILDHSQASAAGEDDEGRIPRTLDAELRGDLIDALLPGETVVLSGILKALENSPGPNQAVAPTASLYLDVNAVSKTNMLESTSQAIHDDDLSLISRLAGDKATLSILVSSFCPHIYGHEMVKLALLLALVGGSPHTSPEVSRSGSSSITVRSDPHILIVGDPGLGKSQLLRFAASVSPRAVYVCANTSTAAGLTASVVEGGLEAGALVLADRGVCCIDEFDKISGQDGWRGLLDVMEQQTVSVAKAGVVCTLPARASILAAANPIGGHYNGAKTVVENLHMDTALLSRFDLILILLDRPNADLDKALSERVLGATSGELRNLTPLMQAVSSTSPSFVGLPERLMQKSTLLLSPSQLRAYIGYVRQRIRPRMSEEAAVILQAYYLELRKHVPSAAAPTLLDLPITTRHLESMIRLAEARAKLEQRNIVTASDAVDTVELMRWCTSDVTTGSNQGPPVGGTTRKRPPSRTAAVRRYAAELIRVSARTSRVDFSHDELHALYDAMRITELPLPELLLHLNESGYLLQRSNREYRLLVT